MGSFQGNIENRITIIILYFSSSCSQFTTLLSKYSEIPKYLKEIKYTKSDPVRDKLGNDLVTNFPLLTLRISEYTWFRVTTFLRTPCSVSVFYYTSQSRKTTYQQLICFPVKNELESVGRCRSNPFYM